MQTIDQDALADMQAATRSLAIKISARANHYALDVETREMLKEWAAQINSKANQFAIEMP